MLIDWKNFYRRDKIFLHIIQKLLVDFGDKCH